MKLLSTIKEFLLTKREHRYRDWRGYSASDALKCIRDLYWMRTGEPTTDPTDLKGQMTFVIGKAIEDGIRKYVFSQLHLRGIHAIGDGQIQVGGSNPPWNGLLDDMLAEREGDRFRKPYIVEIKHIRGFGADTLFRTLQPKDDHMAQSGLYGKDLAEKGITDRGITVYILVSDANYGEMVAFYWVYDRATQCIRVTHAETFYEEGRPVVFEMNIQRQVLDRWKKLEEHYLPKGIEPEPEYEYKKPLTPEFLASVSQKDLAKAIDGEKILGDWRPRYSKYFTKALKVDGTTREYTAEEIGLLRAEHNSRLTPTGRKVRAK